MKSPTQTFTDVRPGDIKYKDQNKDGKIDSNDYYPIGYTSMPQITLGLHGGITFKGFDMDIFFREQLIVLCIAVGNITMLFKMMLRSLV